MVQVDEMIIRVSDMGADQARQMAEEVASRLAAQLSHDFGDRKVDAINIKLFSPEGTGGEAMAENIAAQILRQLKMV